VGVDRESAVKRAEELVREGKIDLAIDEYLRLVDEQPGDVGAANALGDLYVKIGNRASAVAQFNQIADHHRESGFIPKAIAFYKKALKVDPASDRSLSQLALIAVEQELFADATLYLNRLLQRRRELNNEAGVAECLVQLGSFPTANADAKLAAARASAAHFAHDQTARLWIEAADALDRAGRGREAVDVLMQASSLDPEDVELRKRVALACAATGQIDRARAFLSFETAGDHPDLLLALAEHAIAEARDGDARRALERVIAVAPDRRTEAEAMLAPIAAASEPAAESEPEPPLRSVPDDFFAVETNEAIVETDEPVDVAVAFGSGGDDTAAAEPPAAEESVDTSATSANELDWGALLADGGGESDAAPADIEDEPAYVEPEPEPELEPEPEPELEPEPEPEPEVALEPEPEAAVDPEPASEPVTATAAELESIAALTAAARNPALQFQASAQLGRLLLRLGRGAEGIEWLERATQATTAVREQRLDVMYELADALDRTGARRRALDVFADLDFDAASFRDVPERIAALRRALGEGGA
jgi:tetratricopeptide (TPR) repeat protein